MPFSTLVSIVVLDLALPLFFPFFFNFLFLINKVDDFQGTSQISLNNDLPTTDLCTLWKKELFICK